MINSTINLKKEDIGVLSSITALFKGVFIFLLLIINHTYVSANNEQSMVQENELPIDETNSKNDDCVLVQDKINISTSLKSLNAKKISNEVHLSWEVVNAKPESKFIIERSNTGKKFQEIMEIQCDDLSNSIVQYGIIDPNLEVGETYFYRLRYQISNKKSKTYNFIPMKIKITENFITVNN